MKSSTSSQEDRSFTGALSYRCPSIVTEAVTPTIFKSVAAHALSSVNTVETFWPSVMPTQKREMLMSYENAGQCSCPDDEVVEKCSDGLSHPRIHTRHCRRKRGVRPASKYP